MNLMKRLISSTINALLVSLPLIASFAYSVPAFAATPDSKAKSEVCSGIGLVSGNSGCGDNGAAVSHAIAVAINLLSLAVGIAAVVMIIVAGLQFITASGDSNKISSARTSIIYALIGLVIVVFAQTIVHFVLGAV